MNYNEEDFTEINYRNLILKTKKNYEFIFYNDIEKNKTFNNVVWRHDVDISVHKAFTLANIENEESVKSTFFIQLSSAYYNVFEEEIKILIKEILLLGHQIGVHIDPTVYDVNSTEEFEKFLSFEKDILEKLFNTKIYAFSFHNPLEAHLNLGTSEICGMVNTYSSYLQNNFEYCSDSCGYWRHKRLEDFLEKGYENIQVLTHPEWWQNKIMSPRDRVHRCIDGRALKQKINYDKGLEKLGRLNVR
jgi:hypothetical protein